MIDAQLSNLIDDFNNRSTDALGYNTPGYQPLFHDAMQSQVRTVRSFDPLSVVAPQGTFFIVDNGDGSQSYTRAGTFRVSEGKLVAADGRPVLGYPDGAKSGQLAPITVPAGVPDGYVRIAADGTVSYGPPSTDSGVSSTKMPKAAAPIAAAPAPPTGHHRHHHATSAPAPVAAVPPTASNSLAVTTNSVPLPAQSAPTTPGAPSITVLSNSGAPNVAALPTTIDAAPVALPQSRNGNLDPQALASAVPGNAGFPSVQLGPNDNGTSDGSAPTTLTDKSASEALTGGLTNNAPSTPIGKPIGRIAIAKFGASTVINPQGQSSSGAPIEVGAPGTGRLSMLKTSARDIGSVDHMTAILDVSNASSYLNARLQAETALNSASKKAMDLLK